MDKQVIDAIGESIDEFSRDSVNQAQNYIDNDFCNETED